MVVNESFLNKNNKVIHNEWKGIEWMFVSLTTICQISPLYVLYDLKVQQMSNYISKTTTDI